MIPYPKPDREPARELPDGAQEALDREIDDLTDDGDDDDWGWRDYD